MSKKILIGCAALAAMFALAGATFAGSWGHQENGCHWGYYDHSMQAAHTEPSATPQKAPSVSPTAVSRTCGHWYR